MKLHLLTPPVIIIPDAAKTHYIHSDASEVGIGATLSQKDDKGQLRLVACRSRTLVAAAQNYPDYENEMLAPVDSL